MATLKLLVDARLAGAIIGPAGATLRAIKSSTGVRTIQLSQAVASLEAVGGERTVTLTGEPDAVVAAHAQIATAVRTQAGARPRERLRLLVPAAAAKLWVLNPVELRRTSGASVGFSVAAATPKERLIDSTGTPAQLEGVVSHVVGVLATREHARHADFLSRWSFPTDYLDHFETPREAYSDVLPLLRAAAGADGAAALANRRVYDPYYCAGAVVAALAALGCRNVINQNRDFYADVAADAVPPHDLLVTNPPYSGDHKQRLLDFLLSRAQQGRPFLLLMPAWVAGTDYWRAFLRKLAKRRRPKAAAPGGRRVLERRAGVFYVVPREPYAYVHPEKTGHATPPFSTIWFCGGWAGDRERRKAVRGLKSLRASRRIDVFRRGEMLRRRGHFSQRRHDKS
jgi:hypothetical protein